MFFLARYFSTFPGNRPQKIIETTRKKGSPNVGSDPDVQERVQRISPNKRQAEGSLDKRIRVERGMRVDIGVLGKIQYIVPNRYPSENPCQLTYPIRSTECGSYGMVQKLADLFWERTCFIRTRKYCSAYLGPPHPKPSTPNPHTLHFFETPTQRAHELQGLTVSLPGAIPDCGTRQTG